MTNSTVELRLVDYDHLFLTAAVEVASGDTGHPNYQHPQWVRAGGSPVGADRFSQLVIYAALRFEGEALQKGMEEKSVEFKKQGSEIYSKL